MSSGISTLLAPIDNPAALYLLTQAYAVAMDKRLLLGRRAVRQTEQ
jgi:hypothetical protein